MSASEYAQSRVGQGGDGLLREPPRSVDVGRIRPDRLDDGVHPGDDAGVDALRLEVHEDSLWKTGGRRSAKAAIPSCPSAEAIEIAARAAS